MFSYTATILALGAVAFPATVAQFVSAPTNLTTVTGYAGINVRYKEVPTGICEQDPDVKSYAGYADVEENQHIFFWFFEARNQDPSTAPLTVWINGGPGSSSMIGLFQELGPCGVDYDGNVYNNPYSWSNASNMLFIDEPTTVGFSYSIPVPAYENDDSGDIIVLPNNTCPDYVADQSTCGTYSIPDETLTANSTQGAAPNMWKTLQGFMGAFPQYSREEFNFATESYGGHYGPVFNEYIVNQNAKNITGAHTINLKHILIGNGWFDPKIQYPGYYNYTVWPGNTYGVAINGSTADQMYNSVYGYGNCVDQLYNCAATGRNDICIAADNFCYTEVEDVFDTYLGRDEYDVRELTPDPFPYSFYADYLNTPAVQTAIGAFVNFSDYSITTSNAFSATGDDARESNTLESIAALLSQNISITLYFGDADYNCNWIGGRAVAELIAAPGYKTAGFVNITTSDATTHGQVRQAASFAFVRIYESGHEVPFYQPLAALEMFDRVINDRDIATGKLDLSANANANYSTVGPTESTYYEGSGTVQYSILNDTATYNTTTNAPNPPTAESKFRLRRDSVGAGAGVERKASVANRWNKRAMKRRDARKNMAPASERFNMQSMKKRDLRDPRRS
ncbi:MAG: hypothetical protein M1834_001279 [Cirrosporium novae-zelandiae]|nr:MAG: hypothetical protein M1834_001279 [Cirrosporium novae-zelandiae]